MDIWRRLIIEKFSWNIRIKMEWYCPENARQNLSNVLFLVPADKKRKKKKLVNGLIKKALEFGLDNREKMEEDKLINSRYN